MRRPEGVTLIAIWHFILAGVFLLGLCAMTVPIVAVWTGADVNGAVVATIALLVGVFAIIVFGGAFAIVGWGLLGLREWARLAAIVLAVLQLPGFPLATITGGLTIWYLLSNPEVKEAFEAQS